MFKCLKRRKTPRSFHALHRKELEQTTDIFYADIGNNMDQDNEACMTQNGKIVACTAAFTGKDQWEIHPLREDLHPEGFFLFE